MTIRYDFLIYKNKSDLQKGTNQHPRFVVRIFRGAEFGFCKLFAFLKVRHEFNLMNEMLFIQLMLKAPWTFDYVSSYKKSNGIIPINIFNYLQ